MSERASIPLADEVPLDKKAVFGWSMFDFANSSFTTVMVTAYFSLYFQSVVVPPAADGSIGRGSSLWGMTALISQGIVIVTGPLLGALADFSGAKKKFLLFTYLGCSLGTMALALVAKPGWVLPTMIVYIFANFCFSSGENFVSAFLPEIAPARLIGRISGVAWGIGYIGGIGSLIVSVLILSGMDKAGYSEVTAHSWVWVMIGVWFLLGGLPTFLFVKERPSYETMPEGQNMATIGFHRLAETLRHVKHYRQLFRYFFIFTIYAAGVNAVVVFASAIAKEALRFDTTQLGVFLIVLNVSAVFGAFGIGVLQDRIGSKRSIQLALVGWLFALFMAMWVKPTPEGADPDRVSVIFFWIAGNIVGASMGATFAASRALTGLFSPESRSGEFFGLWGLFGKIGAGVGPFVFGTLVGLFDMRIAVLSLAVFFIAGLVGMEFINEAEGHLAAETRSDEPVAAE